MIGFLFVVAIVVTIIVVVKMKKRNEQIEELKNSAGYEVAMQIRNELSQNGYTIGELETKFDFGRVRGDYRIRNDYESGNMVFSYHGRGLTLQEGWLQTNYMCRRRLYAIENDNIGLLIYSDENIYTQDIPKFLEIAANVIRNSGYKFKHPDWMFEKPEAKEYLNVMFQ